MLVPARAAPTSKRTSPVAVNDALSAPDRALIQLGQDLLARGYRFTTITPASHKVVHARQSKKSATLTDIFGWNRPFAERDLPQDLLAVLIEAQALAAADDGLRSAVRFSTLGNQLFAHSAFPTTQADAVFFGPDTYRFARALRHCATTLRARPGMRIVDIGAGSGAGGLYAAALLSQVAPAITLTDINAGALRFSRINTALNGVPDVAVVESDLYASLDGAFDLIISNPPYLVDPQQRLYRHGGGEFGAALSVRIAEEGIGRLAPGGRLLLYTGSAIVDGVDAFYEALRERLDGSAIQFTYEEIDPDVFGEELTHPPYDRADRIAVVAATFDDARSG